MYLYAFTRYAGHDRVFIADLDDVSEWDLVMRENEYYLVLGDDVSWKEQMSYKLQATSHKLQVVIPWLLSAESMALLHRFVNEWYTTYKNSIPLRIYDVEDIVKRRKKSENRNQKIENKNQKSKEKEVYVKNGELIVGEEKMLGQQLIVFPDIRTLENEVWWSKSEIRWRNMRWDEKKWDEIKKNETWWEMDISQLSALGSQFSFLHGQSTKKQRTEAFWWIKNWTIETFVCTSSQIFQDWNDLTRIVLIDQHKRRYKNQKDPRYYVPTILEKMAKIYGCDLIKTGWDLSLK